MNLWELNGSAKLMDLFNQFYYLPTSLQHFSYLPIDLCPENFLIFFQVKDQSNGKVNFLLKKNEHSLGILFLISSEDICKVIQKAMAFIS